MDIYQDYLLRMIFDISRGVGLLKRHEQAVIPTPTNELGDDDMLPEILRGLVSQGHIDEAENLLFRCLENYPLAENFNLGLQFYEYLARLDEAVLRQAGWSREEIRDGLQDLCILLAPALPDGSEVPDLSPG